MMTRGSSFPGKASLSFKTIRGVHVTWRGFTGRDDCQIVRCTLTGLFSRSDLQKQGFSPPSSLTTKLLTHQNAKAIQNLQSPSSNPAMASHCPWDQGQTLTWLRCPMGPGSQSHLSHSKLRCSTSGPELSPAPVRHSRFSLVFRAPAGTLLSFRLPSEIGYFLLVLHSFLFW